jgi:hypothetical protein
VSANDFLDRVFKHVPRGGAPRFKFESWRHQGRPTAEGFGVVPMSGFDVEKLAGRIMDVDHYAGNVDAVAECRSIADSRFSPPTAVRFYQRIKIPALGEIQMDLVLTDHGTRDGFRVLAWHQLDAETEKLNKKRGPRSAYNVGAWLIKPDLVGYALSSAPRKDDVGRIKFGLLTKGADATAGPVVRAAIDGMVRWAKRP